ncbi:Nucleotidyltransferase [Lentinus tigrinus ALCF2SS1-7]|uniref:Nucleotidyltransferase n=1 Tax=Lentinus tigrinus ALCF2SS1-7 TaxID=1328758 RepID=UPI0011663717|nr:Nucleotidyltransferase [Lentinus tigrinus ALCF2SS1-7]
MQGITLAASHDDRAAASPVRQLDNPIDGCSTPSELPLLQVPSRALPSISPPPPLPPLLVYGHTLQRPVPDALMPSTSAYVSPYAYSTLEGPVPESLPFEPSHVMCIDESGLRPAVVFFSRLGGDSDVLHRTSTPRSTAISKESGDHLQYSTTSQIFQSYPCFRRPWDILFHLKSQRGSFMTVLSLGEDEVRSLTVQLISSAITKGYRDAKILPFGSYETKLYLPLGDIDLVMHSSSMMRMDKTGFTIIAKAKVPIVKIVTTYDRFPVDISINQGNGVTTGKMVKQFLQLPALRSLVLIIKNFLSQRSMNEVFTDGLGSYSIVCLAISFLQMPPKIPKSTQSKAPWTVSQSTWLAARISPFAL